MTPPCASIASRIGCTGWSQGGDMTVWGAAMDERIAVAIPVCGWSTWRGRDAGGLSATCNYPRMLSYGQKGEALPTDMDHVAAMIAPRPFLNLHTVA